MSQTRQQKSIFPDLPRDQKLVDHEGNVTSAWADYFNQLTMALQTNFKPEGIVVPPLSSTNIGNLGNTEAAIGNIIYDNTTQTFKGIVLVSIIGNVVTTATKTFTLT